MNKKVIITTLGIAAFSGSFFSSAFAEPVTDGTEFSVTVNPYLNVTLSSNDVHLPITPSSGGTFGETSFTATSSTNNALGYSLNLAIKDTNTAAAQLTTNLTSDTINVNDGTKPVIPTFSTDDILNSTQFSASTSTDHLNHWAMSLNDTDHYKKVLSESTIATSDEPIADDVTTLNLATKLDLLTPPGSYSAYFNFEIVANVTAGSLEQALIDAGKTRVTVGNNRYYKIQDVDATICNTVTDTTGILEVVDVRDNTIYHIGKLADGRCWLLDNLAFNPLASGVSITADNTNASAEAITNFLEGSTTAPYAGWSTEAISYETSTSVFVQPRINVDSISIVPQGADDPLKAQALAGDWKIGVFYNFCAASVGTYCFEPWEGIDANQTSAIDVDQDICPAGWRLPTGGAISSTGTTAGGGEYQNLIDSYPSISGGEDQYTRFRKAARIPLSGLFQDGVAHSQGTAGGSRSSTYAQTHAVYGFSVSTSVVNSNTHERSFGSALRCIVK